MTSNIRIFPVAAEPLDPLAHADAFMSRLRPPAEEDVPLLTEVVKASGPAVGNPGPGPQAAALADLAAVDALLTEWLDTRLPDAVLKVLDGVADQLIQRITREAEEDLLPRLHAALKRVPPAE